MGPVSHRGVTAKLRTTSHLKSPAPALYPKPRRKPLTWGVSCQAHSFWHVHAPERLDPKREPVFAMQSWRPHHLICGTARGARGFSIDFTRADDAFICTAL